MHHCKKKILSHLFWNSASFTSHVGSMFWWRRGSHHVPKLITRDLLVRARRWSINNSIETVAVYVEMRPIWGGGGEGGESRRTSSSCSLHALWPIWNWITDPLFVKFCRVTTVHVCNRKLLSIFFSLEKEARCSAIWAVHDNYWHNWPQYI